MITWFRSVLWKGVVAFLFDPLAFVRWMRGLMLAVAAGGVAFADQLAALVGAPGWVKAIKIAAIVCGFIAGSITAGERNPAPSPAADPASGDGAP